MFLLFNTLKHVQTQNFVQSFCRRTGQENVTLIVSLEVQRGADVRPHQTVELLL